jgi:predicted amidohydrolase YtcJ
VKSIADLRAFAEEAKKSGRGMRGDILEILGIPLEFWSHSDELNDSFNKGPYEHQPVLLRGMDGHTGWANQAILKRVGITSDYLKNLSDGERGYYGIAKNFEPTGFLVDRGMDKALLLLPKANDDRLLAAGRAGPRIQLQSRYHSVVGPACQ